MAKTAAHPQGRQTKISTFFTKQPLHVISTTKASSVIESQPTKLNAKKGTTKNHLRQITSPPLSNDGSDSESGDSLIRGRALQISTRQLSDKPDKSRVTSPSLDSATAGPAASSMSSLQEALARLPARTLQHDRYMVMPINSATMASFERLLKTLLPVAYPPRFYLDILATDSLLGRVAIWNDDSNGEAIAGIKGRLEDIDSDSNQGAHGSPAIVEQELYIQTLGVLAPYRGSGIGGNLLDAVIDEALQLQRVQNNEVSVSGGACTRIVSVYAHVWQDNEDALGWYQRRGFQVEGLLENYYRKLRPAGAWIVRKRLTVGT